jgi:hypothetical protein
MNYEILMKYCGKMVGVSEIKARVQCRFPRFWMMAFIHRLRLS